jgi:hypothetical protein
VELQPKCIGDIAPRRQLLLPAIQWSWGRRDM